jgi:NADH-quinone oxidoreductase subunit I
MDTENTVQRALGNVSIRKVGRDMAPGEHLFVPAIVQGLRATIRHFFKNTFGREKYTTTVQYPDVKTEYPVRFRGMHRLVPREDGTPRCVACFMCQTACPARCIRIVAGETDDARIEKYPVIFEIDELRCVVCGLCVEACPCDAIRMDTGIHPHPVYTREDADFGKADLLKVLGRNESEAARSKAPPPATAAGTGRVDRSHGDSGAGGAEGGYGAHTS